MRVISSIENDQTDDPPCELAGAANNIARAIHRLAEAVERLDRIPIELEGQAAATGSLAESLDGIAIAIDARG